MTSTVGGDDVASGEQSESLYVFGHGRSGTTALARFLNTDTKTLLLHEAFADTEGRYRHWRRRYNLMHQLDGQPPIKGYYLDPSFGETYDEVAEEIRARYRYFGDKEAISTTAQTQYPAMAESIRSRWIDSELPHRVLLTIRHPDAILASSVKRFAIPDTTEAETLQVYVRSLGAVCWLQLAIFFGSRLSAFALMDRGSSCDSNLLAESLELDGFRPCLPQAVFTDPRTHASSGGAGTVEKAISELPNADQYVRYLLLEVFDALEDASSFRSDGLKMHAPQFVCTERSSRLYGSFLALHEHLVDEAILKDACLFDPSDRPIAGILDEEIPNWTPVTSQDAGTAIP